MKIEAAKLKNSLGQKVKIKQYVSIANSRANGLKKLKLFDAMKF